MTSHVISALILPLIVLITILLVPVLSNDQSDQLEVDDSYIGIKGGKTCILSAFRVAVTIRPTNDTFKTITYSNLTPETSQAKHTQCGDGFVQHYYRFNDTHSSLPTGSSHQSLLSVGFEVSPDRSVTINFKFVQVVCRTVGGCFQKGYIHLCRPNMTPSEAKTHNCYLMSASYHLDWIKTNRSHQCSHNRGNNIKDVVYYREMPFLKGEFDINVDFYRIDVITGQYSGHFNPVSYCVMDWILDTTTLIIFGSIVGLIVLLIIVRCLVDCRKSAKKNLKSSVKAKKCVLEDDTHHESQLINTEL